ncbi:hypothetical protein KL86PLE_20090 [uncultured Pleomorphomonas sp.]|uniref:Uncharacterized protein n=1 Tax=uncultured Pleomorphomonas sp. TaxID=442121 RepID=A0A212LCY2_9HYPH|nr:hypothetical protein KL86PLE_20090 [uncultured Pleomorphomonas sp.]
MPPVLELGLGVPRGALAEAGAPGRLARAGAGLQLLDQTPLGLPHQSHRPTRDQHAALAFPVAIGIGHGHIRADRLGGLLADAAHQPVVRPGDTWEMHLRPAVLLGESEGGGNAGDVRDLAKDTVEAVRGFHLSPPIVVVAAHLGTTVITVSP